MQTCPKPPPELLADPGSADLIADNATLSDLTVADAALADQYAACRAQLSVLRSWFDP